MRVRAKLLNLRFSPTLGGFDGTVLQDLQRDKELLGLRERFFLFERVPHLLYLGIHDAAALARISRLPATDGTALTRSGPILPRYCPSLSGHCSARCASGARKQGVPQYVVLTNHQILAIVQERPQSANALSQIDDIDPNREW